MAQAPDFLEEPSPTGLVKLDINKQDPLSSLSGYQPNLTQVNPDTDTVEGRVKGLISSESPLIQGARTRAAQEANKRGLLNSSMALQAGEAAVHEAALPIAAADANIYNARALANQGATNRGSEFNATTTNAAALQERTAQHEKELQTQRGTQAIEQQTLKGSQDLALQNLRGDQSEAITHIEGGYRELLQTSASAASLYSNIIRSVSDALRDPNLDAASKQAFVDRHIDFVESGLAILGGISGLNLTALLQF